MRKIKVFRDKKSKRIVPNHRTPIVSAGIFRQEIRSNLRIAAAKEPSCASLARLPLSGSARRLRNSSIPAHCQRQREARASRIKELGRLASTARKGSKS